MASVFFGDDCYKSNGTWNWGDLAEPLSWSTSVDADEDILVFKEYNEGGKYLSIESFPDIFKPPGDDCAVGTYT